MTDLYQPGERARLNAVGKAIWPMYDELTIVGRKHDHNGYYAGKSNKDDQVYMIRFDGYDYRLRNSPDNCHFAAHPCFSDEPTPDEVDEAIESILKGTP